jgi:uncharacterized OB-fold protein
MSEKLFAAPVADPTSKAVWEAAREGRLLIGLCKDTGKHFWYPRGVSPFTLSPNVDLVEASGAGTIYSYTILRAGGPVCAAYVELAEGPRLFTNIVDCELEAVRIGARVRLVFKASENGGAPVPCFTLA